jgi:multicomponent Na+:H+ antiporter subunit D
VLPLAVLTSGLTGAAVLRVGVRTFLGWGDPATQEGGAETEGEDKDDELDEPLPARVPPTMLLPPVALLAASLLVGIAPPLRRGALLAADGVLDHSGYLQAVLHGNAAAIELPAPVPGTTLVGVVAGLAGVVLAVVLAAMSISPRRLPRARHLLDAPVSLLRRLHSGHLGDYAAWLVLGCGAVVCVLAATAP